MNTTSESVVIEDDDDDVEIIGVSSGAKGDDSSVAGEGSASNVPAHSSTTPSSAPIKHAKTTLPHEIQGYTRPSYNYSRLITQVLASSPERRATSLQICEMIAKKYPYYQHASDLINWRGSIYNALRTRKKFFSIVGTSENNEIIWSFNPTFEQFMLDKWVPKYVLKQTLVTSMKNYVPWLDKTHPQQTDCSTDSQIKSIHKLFNTNFSSSSECSMVGNSSPVTVSSASLSPVIVFSGSLVSCSPGASSLVACEPITSDSSEKDPLEPEVSMHDPAPTIQTDLSVEQDFNPWEPEVTVNEDTLNFNSEPPNTAATEFIRGKPTTTTKVADTTKKQSGDGDFSLDNLHIRHVILKDEIFYRVNFNKEHKSVEKFRLHCTVCDDHLGTSGATCRRKVRLHATLGVLVCMRCYEATRNHAPASCMWCARLDSDRMPMSTEARGRITCNLCNSVFCQVCIERNFGQSWCATMISKRDWKCFRCDTKQIWPHRAIAYFLFRHYREIRRRKDELTKYGTRSPRELRFFIQDLSTCCKSVGSRVSKLTAATVTVPTVAPPVVTNSATPTITSVSSQPLFVIGDQSPSYIYVQTPSSVPSVTLNTGTQYIHNVYPVSSVNTSTMPNTILYTQPPTTAQSFPVMTSQRPTERNQSLSTVPEYSPPPPYPFPDPPPPYSAINVEVTPVHDLTNETSKNTVSNTSVETNGDLVASEAVGRRKINIIVGSSSETSGSDDPIIIPDVDPPEELKIQEEKGITVPALSARERIEKRPMPKSKKQSLLRTVLMNESIESMKRHLQLQPEHHTATDKNEILVSPTVRNDGGQNMEEPILKSIIETATERLLNLQRNQNVSSSTSNNNQETKSVGTVDSPSHTCIDLCENENSSTEMDCQIIDPPIAIPKIKIKTLKELQDPVVFNDNPKSGENLAQKNEEKDANKESYVSDQANKESDVSDQANKESDVSDQPCVNENLELNKKNVIEEAEAEVNITDLKQGIIEASRTLINTQKKFKELAKIISSNLIYKPGQAVDLIMQFHEILKMCHQELDQIDINVKHKFGHLIPSTDIASILQSVIKSKEAPNPNEGPVVLKKRNKRKSKHGNRKFQSAIPEENVEHYLDDDAENIESNQSDALVDNLEAVETDCQPPLKRKRDLLNFNPLGKVILGSPEITEEDLRQMPNTWDPSSQGRSNQNTNVPFHNQVYMDELRRRQFLAKKGAWKRKNIWLTSKRKKRKYTKHPLHNKSGPLMYREDGSLVKRRVGRPRKRKCDSDDDEDEIYRPPNPQYYAIRPRRKSIERSRPLRLSARMHPSTVAHVAQLMTLEPTDVTQSVKPCSVVLERLDPRMVQLLEKSIVDLNDTDDTDEMTNDPELLIHH